MKSGRLVNHGFKADNFDFVGLLRQGIADESGQDVIEYALLGALIGIASIATWNLLVTAVGQAYTAADTNVQAVSACTPNPGGGGCL